MTTPSWIHQSPDQNPIFQGQNQIYQNKKKVTTKNIQNPKNKKEIYQFPTQNQNQITATPHLSTKSAK